MGDREERCGPGTGGPDPDRPVDDFDRIVAGWRREGSVPQWPTDAAPTTEAPDPGDKHGDAAAPAPAEQLPAPREQPVVDDREAPAPDHDEHFVPPDPPPLPRLGPPALVGLALLALGLLLIIAPTVLGMSSVYGLPLGLLSLAAGLGWLVLRLWPSPADDEEPADDDGDDDGAVL